MSAPLYDYDAPNAVVFTLQWISPLGPLGSCGDKRWTAGAPLPYRMVTRIDGADCDQMYDDPLMQIDTFASTDTLAKQASDITHRRMLLLAWDLTNTVTMPDTGLQANAQYVQTKLKPRREDYGDPQIIRYVARYALGLQFFAVPS